MWPGRRGRAETDLIGSLAHGEDAEGVIGVRARDSLARLPSSVYWSALVWWGIFRHRQSQGWYHTNFARLADGHLTAQAVLDSAE